MEVSSKHQMHVFVICILVGVICGIFFDVQRSIRKAAGAGNVRTLLEDSLFTIVCITVIAVTGFLFNRGQMRYYQILGVLSGALFYAAFMSNVTMKILKGLYSAIGKIIVRPIVRTVKFFICPLIKIIKTLKEKLKKTKNSIKRVSGVIRNKAKCIKKRMKML